MFKINNLLLVSLERSKLISKWRAFSKNFSKIIVSAFTPKNKIFLNEVET